MRFSVVTPISDRAEAFEMMAACMARQKFDGHAEWIIVDDSHVPVNVFKVPDSLEVRIIRETPTDGGMTLARNLLTGHRHTRSDTIVFFESQSWYRPDYLETIVSCVEKDGIAIAGAPHVRWYLLWENTWVEEFQNHPVGACLCRTAIRGRAQQALHVGQLQGNKGSGSSDTQLWKSSVPRERAFVADHQLTVKFMGLKGKVRFSSGGTHPRVTARKRWADIESPDSGGERLSEWIGNEDAARYRGLVAT